MDNSIVERMKSILGQGDWIEGENIFPYITDIRGQGEVALGVARPQTTQDVSEIVKICAANDIAIVPQGGNTNVCGSAVPANSRPSLILSLTRMNRIISVDAGSSIIVAEAGCVMQNVQEAAREVDREFAPDWGARGTATVGGAVATNGGGLNVLRYGNTREQVLGMEVVLPDGRIWDGLRSLRKDNSGYDMKQLFIGSEGTLGIITKIVFRLHPLQPIQQSMLAVISDESRLMELFDLAKSIAGDQLTAFEIIPGLGVEKALERYPDLQRPIETRAEWYLLIRFSGRESVESSLLQLFENGLEAGLLDDGVMTQSLAQENNLWEIREQMIPYQYFTRKLLKWDVSVPLDKIMTFLAEAREIAHIHQSSAIFYAVGHVGDGNIHLSIFPEGEDGPELEELSRSIYDEIDRLIWSYRGSISAEHGVGVAMLGRIKKQKSSVEYEMLQRTKNLFDPEGILNPGKLLDSG